MLVFHMLCRISLQKRTELRTRAAICIVLHLHPIFSPIGNTPPCTCRRGEKQNLVRSCDFTMPVIMASDRQPMISYSNHSSICLCYGDHILTSVVTGPCWPVDSHFHLQHGVSDYSTLTICLKFTVFCHRFRDIDTRIAALLNPCYTFGGCVGLKECPSSYSWS